MDKGQIRLRILGLISTLAECNASSWSFVNWLKLQILKPQLLSIYCISSGVQANWFSQLKEKKSPCWACVNFCSVNTPTTPDFKPSTWCYRTQSWEEMCRQALMSWQRHWLLFTTVLYLNPRQTRNSNDIVYIGISEKQAVGGGRQNIIHFFTKIIKCALILWRKWPDEF